MMNESMPMRLDDADVAVLVAYLVEERTGQENLHSALERIESKVVSGAAEGLAEELVALKPLLSRLESLGSRRTKVLGHLSKKVGVQAAPSQLDALLQVIPEDRRAKVEENRRCLRDLVMRTRRLNGRVNMLLRHSMSFNRDLLRGIFDLADPQVVYSADGRTAERGDDVILDRSL